MIKGVHAMYYSSEADELRRFIRDKLGFRAVDVGEGWLIFDLPEAEMGCHPVDPAQGAVSGGSHVSFYCDNLERTISELKAKGVEFVGEPNDQGFAMVTHFKAPGSFDIMLYEPRYITPAASRPKPPRSKPARAKSKTANPSTRAKKSTTAQAVKKAKAKPAKKKRRVVAVRLSSII